MDTISYSHARTNFSKILDRVCHGHEALVITRKQHPSVVLLSLAEYDNLVGKAKQGLPGPTYKQNEPQANDSQSVSGAIVESHFRVGYSPANSQRDMSFNDFN